MVPGNQHLPRVAGHHPGEDLEQGGLAAAVLAEQPHHLPGGKAQVEALEGRDGSEVLGQATHLDGIVSGGVAAPRGYALSGS